MGSPNPVVGDWYRHNGALFEVVAIDRDDGTVEVQHFDGTLEEFDLDTWAPGYPLLSRTGRTSSAETVRAVGARWRY